MVQLSKDDRHGAPAGNHRAEPPLRTATRIAVPPHNSLGHEIGPVGEHPGILRSPRHNRNGRNADGVFGRHNQLDIAGNSH